MSVLIGIIANFKQRLETRGYPKQDIERDLSEVNFDHAKIIGAKTKAKSKERILPSSCYNIHPAVQDLKRH